MGGIFPAAAGYGVTLEVHVLPRSSVTKLIATPRGWKLKITAPPVDGEANREICAFFAKVLGLPKTSVRLKSGEKSKHKTLLIEGIDGDRALDILSKLGAQP